MLSVFPSDATIQALLIQDILDLKEIDDADDLQFELTEIYQVLCLMNIRSR